RAGLDATVELVEGATHPVDGQVFPDLDAEPVALEFVRDVAGVVDGFLQRSFGVGILRVADDKRKPLGATVRGDRRDERRDRQNQGHKQCEANSHKTAVQPTGRRFQLAPRRPYSTQTALSNRARKSCQPSGSGAHSVKKAMKPSSARAQARSL